MQKILWQRACLKPGIPDIFVRFALPQIEDMGPAHLERQDIHDYVSATAVRYAQKFFDRLIADECVRYCLSFDQGRGLIERGAVPIWFPSTHLCLWRSVAYDVHGNACVPWIQNIRGQTPVIRWWWLEYDLYESHRTFLFDQKLLPHFGRPAL